MFPSFMSARPRVIVVRAAGLFTIVAGIMASALPSADAEAPAVESASAALGAPDGAYAQIQAPVAAEFAYAPINVKVAKPKPATVYSARSSIVKNPPPPRLDPDKVMKEAAKYVGSPYLAGGSTPKGFDCSGFTSYVFGKLGVTVPRSSSAYWNFGTRIAAKDALPGDLLLLPGHVGIYAGNGKMIDAPHAGLTVQFRPMWTKDYVYIRVP